MAEFLLAIKFLIIFLDGCQDQVWATQSPELSNVSLRFSLIARGVPRVEVFYLKQAITHCKLEITAIPAICSELLADWKAVHDYLIRLLPLRRTKESEAGLRVWSGPS